MEKLRFGVQLDCSRTAVKKVSEVKKFVDAVSKMGYNALYLYMEDTYEIEGEPYFGHLRGRFTASELKELDAYCDKKGVELIPAIQTLAHLMRIFNWSVYKPLHDIDDIIIAGDEKTYALIDKMLATAAKCFKTRTINIGMDEALHLGLGEYLNRFGYEKRSTILAKHLARVSDLCKKHGLNPMMWSDMFIKVANNDDYYPQKPNYKAISEQKASVPDNVKLIYWDYYHDKKADYERSIKMHECLADDFVFAGGIRTWNSFAPHQKASAKKMQAAMDVCRERGVKDIIVTTWGDDGNECSQFTALPTLMFIIERFKNGSTRKESDEKFYKTFGVKAENFYALDALDFYNGMNHLGFSKIFTYSDPIMGLFDYHIKDGTGKYYKSLAMKYKRMIKTSGEYGYLFENAYRLADFLSVKAEIGNVTRKSYLAGDKAALKYLCDKVYPALIKKHNAFYEAFKTVWFTENKPFGFEVHDLRLGGLKMRLEQLRIRVKDYLSGKIDKIEELEAPVLPFADFNGYVSEFHVALLSASSVDGK